MQLCNRALLYEPQYSLDQLNLSPAHFIKGQLHHNVLDMVWNFWLFKVHQTSMILGLLKEKLHQNNLSKKESSTRC